MKCAVLCTSSREKEKIERRLLEGRKKRGASSLFGLAPAPKLRLSPTSSRLIIDLIDFHVERPFLNSLFPTNLLIRPCFSFICASLLTFDRFDPGCRSLCNWHWRQHHHQPPLSTFQSRTARLRLWLQLAPTRLGPWQTQTQARESRIWGKVTRA